jgi:Ca2+-binding RTX toxin-like protein
MTIYNMNGGSLESLLQQSFSPGTESAIIDAIRSAGIVALGSGTTGVEVEKKSGSYSIPNQVQVFLDTGSHNRISVKDDGAKLIAAGDGANRIIDKGPGGDTLVGGAGQESLKVTHGENLLIAGNGENTLIGGAGHDTLVGGGSSLLEAGRGGSTLTGGLGASSSDTLIGGHGHDLLQVSHGENRGSSPLVSANNIK